jgi:hypothetical protein
MTRLSLRASNLSLALLFAACVGKTDFVDPPAMEHDPSHDGDADGGTKGDDHPNQCFIPQAVYFGTTGPTAVQLSDDQITAIGMLIISGSGLCSGTLVRRDWVITAKHCTVDADASELQFLVGRKFDQPSRSYGVLEKFENPDRDTTLLHLDSSPLDDDPNIQPLRINDEALEGREGEIFEASGYGERCDGPLNQFGLCNEENKAYGARYFTAEPIDSLDDEFVSVDGEGKHGLCGGDSGGPLLGNFADGPRVTGDLLGGDENCRGVDTYTRTDKQIAWIDGILGDDNTNQGCGTLTAQGRCDADVASWCESGVKKSESCSQDGKVCKYDAGAGGYRCLSENDCGNVSEEGECDSVTARWCDDGELKQQNCATEGLLCGRDEKTGNTRCIEDPCKGLSGGGECRGDTAVVCIGQSLMKVDCSECGQTCKIGAAGPECD